MATHSHSQQPSEMPGSWQLSSGLPPAAAAAAPRTEEEPAHTRSQLSAPPSGIPGSSPNWRACNVKSKGKAAASAPPPPSMLHAATLARWGTTGGEAHAGSAAAASRRHFHHLPLAQTRARDCLPCVDAAAKQQQQQTKACASGSMSSIGTQPQWRRHRRMVPAPAANARKEGRRMVGGPQSGDGSQCKALLQDPPPPPQHTTAAAAAAAGLSDRLSLLKMDPALLAPPARARAAAAAAVRQPSLAPGTTLVASVSSGTLNTSSSTATPAAAQQVPPGSLTPVSAASAAAASWPSRDRGVESNPDFFRTPKESPTLARFIASLQPVDGGGTTAQRRVAGLHAHQAAQVAAAEVAALPAALGGGSADD